MAKTETRAQLRRVSRPFGEVNVGGSVNGRRQVSVTVPMGVHKEGSQTGVALDASGSMQASYNEPLGGGPSELCRVARHFCSHLAGNVDADGGTTAIYWALGRSGGDTQFIADLTTETAPSHPFAAPAHLGGGTKLLPAVRYFVERFADAPWGIFVFLTDGVWSDHKEVKEYGLALARRIKSGQRNPLKLVVVGVGDGVEEKQMAELDDLTEGTDLPDIWDHKIARDMRGVTDIFAEVVEANARVAVTGKITAPDGTLVKDYSDSGVPGKLEFEVPDHLPYFTLVADGRRFHQALSDDDGLNVPASDPLPGDAALPGVVPGTQFAKEIPPLPGSGDSGGTRGGEKGDTKGDGSQTTVQVGIGRDTVGGGAPQEITDFDVTGLAREGDAAPIDLNNK
jgi:hypothetical protein